MDREESSGRPADRRDERLEKVLGALVAGEGHDLLKESLHEARLEAKRYLTGVLADRLIEDAVTELHAALGRRAGKTEEATGARKATDAPTLTPSPEKTTPREVGTLAYVYAIADSDHPYAGGEAGIVPEHEVRAIQGKDVRAFVSAVPANEFSGERLHENLNRFEWLEEKARGHERVLEALGRRGTIVPLRFCTLYEGDDGVRKLLVRHSSTFEEALSRLRGRSEWGVKVFCDIPSVIELLDGSPTSSGAGEGYGSVGEGTSYLEKQRRRGDLEERARTVVGRVTAAVEEGLARIADEVVELPPQSRELTKDDRTMASNRSYLVPSERSDDFVSTARALHEEHGHSGLSVEITGPWPPYSFVVLDLTGEADGSPRP